MLDGGNNADPGPQPAPLPTAPGLPAAQYPIPQQVIENPVQPVLGYRKIPTIRLVPLKYRPMAPGMGTLLGHKGFYLPGQLWIGHLRQGLIKQPTKPEFARR